MIIKRIFAGFAVLCLGTGIFVPFLAVADDAYEQEFIITAYYSPLPDQCCYVKGSYTADMVLNGEGLYGADGTAVYPGMAAAPKSYAFGTRISLPGIGTVTVHDRGGAIQELDSGAHRLDLWVGHGEEGLARALAFGVRRVKAKVYPLGSAQPENSLDLAVLKAPLDTLRSYRTTEPSLLSLKVAKGDHSLSVKLLQEQLKKVGYFTGSPTGTFGDATVESLQKFQKEYSILASADVLDERTAAFLSVVSKRKKEDGLSFLDSTRRLKPAETATVKRVLRYLGYYRGRSTTIADVPLKKAVTLFQKEHKLIASETEAAAGTLGPKTRALLHTLWRKQIVTQKAEEVLFVARVNDLVADKDLFVEQFLGKGSKGAEVKKLQKFLTDRGYLPQGKISGMFGEETEAALTQYQVSAKIIEKENSKGAGYVGPETIAHMRRDIQRQAFLNVRARGWSVL